MTDLLHYIALSLLPSWSWLHVAERLRNFPFQPDRLNFENSDFFVVNRKVSLYVCHAFVIDDLTIKYYLSINTIIFHLSVLLDEDLIVRFILIEMVIGGWLETC